MFEWLNGPVLQMNNNDGEAISFSGSMSIGNNENDRKLQGKCETLLEEYEEEITVRIYSYFCLHLPAA